MEEEGFLDEKERDCKSNVTICKNSTCNYSTCNYTI